MVGSLERPDGMRCREVFEVEIGNRNGRVESVELENHTTIHLSAVLPFFANSHITTIKVSIKMTEDQQLTSTVSQNSMPLYLPSHASLLSNQSIVTPPPPSHYLSAADDLIDRFQLHESYRVLLHPFRKDLPHQQSAAEESRPTTPGGTIKNALAPEDANTSQAHALPKTFAHFLPATLPGKVRPTRPPRSRTFQARRAAIQADEDQLPLDKREKSLAKAAADWDRVSTTLRKAVMKPEYTAADIKPLDEEAIKGYQVQAGEVPDVSMRELADVR